MTEIVSEPEPAAGAAELDAYSRVVTSVAAELTPSVAALYRSRRTRSGRIDAGAGSAVVFIDDGFLLTNAHVVGNAQSGTVNFSDGSRSAFRVIGTDPLETESMSRAKLAIA